MAEACPATGGNEAKQLVCLLMDEAMLRGFGGSLTPIHLASWTGFHLLIIPKSLQ